MPKARRTALAQQTDLRQILALLRKTAKSNANRSNKVLALLQKTAKSNANDSRKILDVLQALFILEATRMGMSIDDMREVLNIRNNRVTAVTRHIDRELPGVTDAVPRD